MQKIREKLRSAYAKLAEYLTSKDVRGDFELMNLHVKVRNAFLAAQKPVERRTEPSKFEKTSKGKNWYPRGRHYPARVTDLPKNMHLPKKSPFLVEVAFRDRTYLQRHGTLERVDKLLAAA